MPQKKSTATPAARPAKTVAKTSSPAVVMAETEPTRTVILQVTIGLPDGKSFTLDTGDLTKAMDKGFAFSLAEPVVLGTLTDLMAWVKDAFGVELPDPAGWPKPFDGLALMSVTIKSFSIDTTKEQTAYALEITIEKNKDNPPKIPLINLTIDKIGFAIAQGEPVPTPPA